VPQFPAYRVAEFGAVSGEVAMRTEIAARGPISCGMCVTEDFEAYSGGVRPENAPTPRPKTLKWVRPSKESVGDKTRVLVRAASVRGSERPAGVHHDVSACVDMAHEISIAGDPHLSSNFTPYSDPGILGSI
jgi:hypothetical protein